MSNQADWQVIASTHLNEDANRDLKSTTSVLPVAGGHLFRVSSQITTTKGVACSEALCFVPDQDVQIAEAPEPEPDLDARSRG